MGAAQDSYSPKGSKLDPCRFFIHSEMEPVVYEQVSKITRNLFFNLFEYGNWVVDTL